MNLPYRNNAILHLLLAWFVVIWGITAIDPLYPRDWWLENLLVFASVAAIVLGYRRFQFSNTSYALITAFLSLHVVGAHYTYAETPLGFWIQDWLALERNHYDRIVHFGFGLLLAFPVRELLLRRSGIGRGWSYFMSVNCIVAASAVYEILESIIAVIVEPELGAAYLGTQGDEWDAQKDAGLAAAGATIAMLAAWIAARRGKAAG